MLSEENESFISILTPVTWQGQGALGVEREPGGKGEWLPPPGPFLLQDREEATPSGTQGKSKHNSLLSALSL